MDIISLQHTQYPLLRLGFAFLLFSIVCFLNYYSLHGRSFWKWQGLFIFFLGLHDALHLLEPLVPVAVFVDIGAVVLLACSMFVFLEIFYINIKDRVGLIRVGAWIAGMVLIMVLAGSGGWKFAHFMMALIVPVLVLGWILRGSTSFIKEEKTPWQRSLLRLSMVLMGFYIGTLTVLPRSDTFSIGLWDQEMFLMHWGFPVQILRSIFIIAATVVLWIYHVRGVKQRVSEGAGKFIVFWERIFLAALTAVLLTGWFFVSWVGDKVQRDEKSRLLGITRTITAGVNPRWIEKLALTSEDQKLPEHIRLREQQITFARAIWPRGDVRWLYLMAMRDGRIIFLTDSISVNDPNYSAPGDIYTDAPDELYKVFQDGKERVIGPYQDRWGTFISGFVPIRSFETGKIVAVQGLDVNLAALILKVFQAKLFVVSILILLVVLMGLFFLWQIRTRESEDRLKIAFDNLQQAKDDLEKTQDRLFQSEKLAAIGTLAAGVAHEINNPLGFIQGNLTVLSQYVMTFLDLMSGHDKLKSAIRDADMGRLKELEHEIRQAEDKANIGFLKEDVPGLLKETIYGVERINKIVTALQHFSYASHGEKKLTSVNDALEGIMSMVSSEVMAKADLFKEYGDVPPVNANEEQLKQVFINILLNAAQAIRQRGVICIRTRVQGAEAVIEIEDTGPGIAKEVMPKIFDPFFTTKGPGSGTGLGLSISYDIIKKHKGRIEVESEVGQGTTFRIFLPLSKDI